MPRSCIHLNELGISFIYPLWKLHYIWINWSQMLNLRVTEVWCILVPLYLKEIWPLVPRCQGSGNLLRKGMSENTICYEHSHLYVIVGHISIHILNIGLYRDANGTMILYYDPCAASNIVSLVTKLGFFHTWCSPLNEFNAFGLPPLALVINYLLPGREI